MLFQLADSGQRIYCIACEAGNRLGDDKIDLSGQRILDHAIESLSFGCAGPGDSLIRIHRNKLPMVGMFLGLYELLEDSAFDLEGFIIDQFAQRIGDAEEEAFIHGDGIAKPLGLIYQLDREVISEKADKISTDDLLELKHRCVKVVQVFP